MLKLRKPVRPQSGDVLGGLVAGLYSIPEGIGYAQLALINPMMGVYSGMVPVLVTALGAGTVRMIATLTSAIALTVGGILAAGVIPAEQAAAAVVTISLFVGILMIILGLLRLGKLMNVISHSVMSGFIIGIGLLIIAAKVPEVLGYKPEASSNKALEAIAVIAQPTHWNLTTAIIGFFTTVGALALQQWKPLKKVALLIVLAIGTGVVWVGGITTPVVSDSATIESGVSALPFPRSWDQLPDLTLMPQLAITALAVTIIALSEGAGIRPAFPNLDAKKSSISRDFLAVGAANIAGSFFQSPPVGGSLSRTQLSTSSGGSTRWAGIFACLWLVVIVFCFALVIAEIPNAVIAGLLVVIGLEIIRGRRADVRLARSAGPINFSLLVLTTVLVLSVPVQWAIGIPILLSVGEFVVMSVGRVRLVTFVRDEQGWCAQEGRPESTLAAGSVTVLRREGPEFHAAVPGLIDSLPRPVTGATPAVVVLDISSVMRLSDTLIHGLSGYVEELHSAHCTLVLTGVWPQVADTLAASRLTELVESQNVLMHVPHLGLNLEQGWQRAAQVLLQNEGADEPSA